MRAMPIITTENFNEIYPQLLIGFAGNMGAGKSTLTAYMVSQYYFTECAFAGILKQIASLLYGSVSKSKEGRSQLQKLGAKLRELDPKIWINAAFRESDPIASVVYSDIRHLNEAEAILAKGGKIIYLDVPDAIRKARIESRDQISISDTEWKQMHDHPSEQEVPKIRGLEEVVILSVDETDTEEMVYRKLNHLLGIHYPELKQ